MYDLRELFEGGEEGREAESKGGQGDKCYAEEEVGVSFVDALSEEVCEAVSVLNESCLH